MQPAASLSSMNGTLPVLPSDYDALSDFLAGFPGETNPRSFWLDRFVLWWDRNPAFRAGAERGWLLRKDGTVVGFCGMVPSWFQRGGEETVALTATTWRVLPEFRSQSLTLFLAVLRAARDTVIFCTTPGEATVAVLKAMKFGLLPRRDGRRSVVPIHASRVAAAQVGDRRGQAVLTAVLAGGLAAWSALQLRRLRRSRTGTEVRPLAQADSRFDALWERTKGRHANTNVRRAEVINWFCFGHPGMRKTLLGAYANDNLVGYGIFRLNAENRFGLKVFECLDLWPDPAEEHVLQALVRGATEQAEAHGYDLLAVPHFSSGLASGLRELGLIQLAGRERRDYFRMEGRHVGGMTEANSYFVAAQGDDGL